MNPCPSHPFQLSTGRALPRRGRKSRVGIAQRFPPQDLAAKQGKQCPCRLGFRPNMLINCSNLPQRANPHPSPLPRRGRKSRVGIAKRFPPQGLSRKTNKDGPYGSSITHKNTPRGKPSPRPSPKEREKNQNSFVPFPPSTGRVLPSEREKAPK